MLSTFSPYSPQGLLPQFSGIPADSGQSGPSQQVSVGGQMNPFLQNPFSQGQLSPGPFATNPVQHSQWLQSPIAQNPLLSSFAGHAGANIAQQVVQTFGQLAQQIQGAVAQQIGIAVHQLAHQLATQALQGYPGGGFGVGQSFAPTGQPFVQGGYGGFSPQAQGWGANRQQTIQ